MRASTVLRLLPAALFVFGCAETGGGTGPTTPTLVAVAPQDFAGAVPCTDAPGAMRRYVVTLFDLGSALEPSAPFALPSGVVRNDAGGFGPTPCEQTAAFAFVIPGHRYDAEVDVYDRTDLRALGPGGRHLVDEQTGEYVPPRWTTTCGRKVGGSSAEGPVTAAWYLTRYVRGCEPLETQAPATPTGILVGLSDALGTLECGNGPDAVSRFTAALTGSPAAPTEAACGEQVEFSGLEAGTSYEFDVAAYESSAATPRWSTRCHRIAELGAIVTAACDPLLEIAE